MNKHRSPSAIIKFSRLAGSKMIVNYIKFICIPRKPDMIHETCWTWTFNDDKIKALMTRLHKKTSEVKHWDKCLAGATSRPNVICIQRRGSSMTHPPPIMHRAPQNPWILNKRATGWTPLLLAWLSNGAGPRPLSVPFLIRTSGISQPSRFG